MCSFDFRTFFNYSRSCHQVAIPLYTFMFITLTLLSLAASRACVTLEPSCMTLLTNESPIAQSVGASNRYLVMDSTPVGRNQKRFS